MQDEESRQAELRIRFQRRLEKVTAELLSEFLYKRGVPVVKCLLCSSEDIVIPQTRLLQSGPDGRSSATYVDFIKVDAGGPPLSLMHYQYRLICKNCGFTSHLAVWPVLQWLEGEKSEQ